MTVILKERRDADEKGAGKGAPRKKAAAKNAAAKKKPERRARGFPEHGDVLSQEDLQLLLPPGFGCLKDAFNS